MIKFNQKGISTARPVPLRFLLSIAMTLAATPCFSEKNFNLDFGFGVSPASVISLPNIQLTYYPDQLPGFYAGLSVGSLLLIQHGGLVTGYELYGIALEVALDGTAMPTDDLTGFGTDQHHFYGLTLNPKIAFRYYTSDELGSSTKRQSSMYLFGRAGPSFLIVSETNLESLSLVQRAKVLGIPVHMEFGFGFVL